VKQQPRPTIDVEEFDAWRVANPEPAPDLPMLRKVISAIDADRGKWNQSTWGHFIQDQSGEWSCGTARCVAGWAATFSPTLVTEQQFAGALPELCVADTGAYALGLTRGEAIDLFESTLYVSINAGDGTFANKKEQRANIQVVAERIAARAGETL
jgi:hypothetical protein